MLPDDPGQIGFPDMHKGNLPYGAVNLQSLSTADVGFLNYAPHTFWLDGGSKRNGQLVYGFICTQIEGLESSEWYITYGYRVAHKIVLKTPQLHVLGKLEPTPVIDFNLYVNQLSLEALFLQRIVLRGEIIAYNIGLLLFVYNYCIAKNFLGYGKW